jgi:polar amino acid transport system substrate-binding protein
MYDLLKYFFRQSLLKKFSLISLSTLILSTISQPISANTVLENVTRTGKLIVGTSKDLVPYAYYNEKDELVGYSIDIVNLIKAELEQELNRNIELVFVETNSIAEAIPKIETNEIDMTCNASFTWERDEFVDFTARYSVVNLQLLVAKNSGISSSQSLAGKKIAVPPVDFAHALLKLSEPDAILVDVDSLVEGIDAVKNGTVEGLIGDTIILDGLRQQIDPDEFTVIPLLKQSAYGRHGLGCIVAHNNSSFLFIANKAIIRLMNDYLIGKPEAQEIINRWFGPDGVVQGISTQDIENYFKNNILNYEQIPPNLP